MLMVVLHHFYSGAIFGALVGIIVAVLASISSAASNDIGLGKWAINLAESIVMGAVSLALLFGSVWSIINIIFSWLQ